jgi:CRP-like cAMP-binding protein
MTQPDIESPVAVSDAHTRAVARICTEFFLEAAVGIADFFKGELVTALVFLAIMRENVRHIDHTPENASAYGVRTAPPDSEREPVTIYVVAKALGLTYETARRHVKRLVEDGYCLRTERGLLVPAEVLTRPEVVRANERNLANFNRLLTNAVRAGLIEVAVKAD